jgi:hypothetical protein
MDLTAPLLFVVAFSVGAFNIVVGPTGGVMAGATAALVPPPASVLLHASVSWWSSLGRCAVLRAHVNWRLLGRLSATSLPALVIALVIGIQVSSSVWRLVLAAFLAGWACSARFRGVLSHPRTATTAAVLAGAASAVVGTGGVVVMPTIRSACGTPDEALATEAALTVVQNSLKIVVLLVDHHVALPQQGVNLAVMLAGATLGLLAGRRVSLRLSDVRRDTLLKAALLGVAGWLVTSALL